MGVRRSSVPAQTEPGTGSATTQPPHCLADPVVGEIARKHGKTPAQVIIRWRLDNDLIVIPKSVTPSRIRENIGVFDFKLDAGDLDRLAALDSADGRIGPDPNTADF